MKYLVELMEGEAVVSSVILEASTPFAAASKGAGREVTFKVDRAAWLRVTSTGRPSLEFGYAN